MGIVANGMLGLTLAHRFASPTAPARRQERHSRAAQAGAEPQRRQVNSIGTEWRAFFDDLQDASPLYREQAALYLRSLRASVPLRHDQRVLDFGCGFAFVEALLAPLVGHVCLWDPSPTMRTASKRQTADLPNVSFCDLSTVAPGSGAPDEWRGRPFDLILVNSVVQYMTPDELSAWLPRWRAMLTTAGAVVLSDLIPPDHRGQHDVVDLLRLGVRHGSTLRGVREALGGVTRYWRTSRAAPLQRVGSEDLARRAAAAGLTVTALPANLTHFRRRWAALLRPQSSG